MKKSPENERGIGLGIWRLGGGKEFLIDLQRWKILGVFSHFALKSPL